MIYVIGGCDHDVILWKHRNPTLAPDVVELRSWRPLVGRLYLPDDRLELIGTWWNRVDTRRMIEEIHISLCKARVPSEQMWGIVRPLVEDWHRAKALT